MDFSQISLLLVVAAFSGIIVKKLKQPILIGYLFAGLGREEMNPYGLLLLVVKGLGLFVVIWLLSKKVLPALFERYVPRSSELLFIVSIAWALGLASLVAGPLGFTLEIGGFLAGLALSNLPEHIEIASRTRPLRDFFLTIFFFYIGTKVYVCREIFELLPEAGVFSIFVLV